MRVTGTGENGGMLKGWKAIIAHVGPQIGGIGMATVRRYAARDDDPMPVKKDGTRVIAVAEELDRWLERQFQPAGRRNQVE